MALFGKERVKNDAGDYKVRLAEIVPTKQHKVLETDLEFWELARIQGCVDTVFCILLKINRKENCIRYFSFYRSQLIC